MSNFNTKFGVLFFPLFPEFWNDFKIDYRKKMLAPIYNKKYPSYKKERIDSMQKPEASMEWSQLETKIQNALQKFSQVEPDSVKPIPNPKDHDMGLFLMRMDPSDSPEAVQMRNQTIRAIFDGIVAGIPLVAKP